MTPLLFRCEATAELGMGHVLRGLALAAEWRRRGGRVVFALARPEPAIAGRLRSAGAELEVLPVAPGTAADAQGTDNLARRLGGGWTVVDGPSFGEEWERAWPAESPLLRVDDNGLTRPFRAELVLNQNLGATEADYPECADARLLLGPDFALLRPEFCTVPAVSRSSRLLVTMGGSDPAGATERVLAALQLEEAAHVAADFIIGGSNPRRESLLVAINASGPRLRAVCAPEDLPVRFAQAACAVTAGGSTLYELALLGTPMLVLATAGNQCRTCERFAAAGVARYLGWHADLARAELAAGIAAFAADGAAQRRYSARAATLVDGRGASRVADALLAGGRR